MQAVQRIAGGMVALTAAALIVFAVDKGAQPAGKSVPYVLTAVLVCAAAVWLTTLPLGRLERRIETLQTERDAATSERDTARGERDALGETTETLRSERDEAQGAIRQMRAEAEAAGRPRLPEIVRDRVIDLSEMPPWIYKRTFEDCELVGPGPAWIGPSQRQECVGLGLTKDSFLEVEDMAGLPEGTVRFIDCRLIRCHLQSVVLAGTRQQLVDLRGLAEPTGLQ